MLFCRKDENILGETIQLSGKDRAAIMWTSMLVLDFWNVRKTKPNK